MYNDMHDLALLSTSQITLVLQSCTQSMTVRPSFLYSPNSLWRWASPFAVCLYSQGDVELDPQLTAGSCNLQTSEAERIGVNQVAKVHATSNPTGTDQCEPSCSTA